VFYPKNEPFLSKDTNHIESFESFLYKQQANYNNQKITRKITTKSVKQSHILSGFRLNSSQKTSEVYVSHVFEPISIIYLLKVPRIRRKTVYCVS
jgi:hypothetical protein